MRLVKSRFERWYIGTMANIVEGDLVRELDRKGKTKAPTWIVYEVFSLYNGSPMAALYTADDPGSRHWVELKYLRKIRSGPVKSST